MTDCLVLFSQNQRHFLTKSFFIPSHFFFGSYEMMENLVCRCVFVFLDGKRCVASVSPVQCSVCVECQANDKQPLYRQNELCTAL